MANLQNAAFVTIAKSNSTLFPESLSNDLLIGTLSNSQRILFGTAENPSLMTIASSNVKIGGSFAAEMIAIGGQIIGTGTELVFSPISTGWAITDNADKSIGIGLGPQRIQFTNSFLQWSHTTTMPVTENQPFNTTITNVGFQYQNLDLDETTFSKASVSILGKQISQDFALDNNSTKFVLTGPSGVFTIGFDQVTTLVKDYDETIKFRLYYNKRTDLNNFENYFVLNGSQFVTVMLPNYCQLIVKYDPSDNPSKSFTLNTSTVLRMTRLTVIEA
jgi:hypothetical protein